MCRGRAQVFDPQAAFTAGEECGRRARPRNACYPARQRPGAAGFRRRGFATLRYKAGIYWRIGKTFKGFCKKAKITGVSLHSLRRTFTVKLLEAGTNSSVVQSLLGHSTIALTMEVYGRARKEDIQSAINDLDQ